MAKKKHKHLIKLNPTQQCILALVLFAFATLLSREHTLSQLETDIFYAFYGLPEWLYKPFYFITQFGSVLLLGALVAAYFARQHYHIVIRLLMAGGLAYLVSGLAKSVWGRPRPHKLLPDVTTLDYFQGPGFPSGHTALATALAFTVGHYLGKKYWWVTAIWVIGVASSRMYLGVHLPLDILGGFAIGWFSYALFRHVRLYDVRHKHAKQS